MSECPINGVNTGYNSGTNGTGSVVDKSGLIITNCHVVKSNQYVDIKLAVPVEATHLFPNKQTVGTIDDIRGRVVYCQPDKDLAVIRVYVKEDSLPALVLPEHQVLKVGEPIVVFGYPDLSWSTSVGVLKGWEDSNVYNSVYNNNIVTVKTFLTGRHLEHVTPTAPGFSGGPILDRNSAVVGIHTCRSVFTGCGSLAADANGMSANGLVVGNGWEMVLKNAKEFELKTMREKYSMAGKRYLGVTLKFMSQTFCVMSSAINRPLNVSEKYLRINDTIEEINGKPLNSFTQLDEELQSLRDEESRSYLRINDTIEEINGKPLNSFTQLDEELQSLRDEESVWLTVYRGDEINVSLVASIPAIIAGNDWYEYIRHNNTTKSHTNSSLKPLLTLRSVHLLDWMAREKMWQIYNQSLPSVVMVYTKASRGTASIVDKTGLIITNCHVVTDWQYVYVNFTAPVEATDVYTNRIPQGTIDVIPGRVVYCQPDKDLAVIRVYVKKDSLPALVLSDRQDLKPGEPVMVFGYPDRGLSVAVGEMLGADRPDMTVNDADYSIGVDNIYLVNPHVEHSAPAIPGFSGSPVLDSKGAVVGIHNSGHLFTACGPLATDAIVVLKNAKKFELKTMREKYSMAGKRYLGVMLDQCPDSFWVMSSAINRPLNVS
ncbi:unnamed protein product, partial [Medioppia subpectinata]